MTNTRMTELRQAVETGTRREAIAAAEELIAEVKKLQRRRDAAKGPTLSEVMTYAAEIGLNSGHPEDFYDHYSAVGWVYGKCRHPIRDWQSALRRWKRKVSPVGGRTDRIGSRFGVGG